MTTFNFFQPDMPIAGPLVISLIVALLCGVFCAARKVTEKVFYLVFVAVFSVATVGTLALARSISAHAASRNNEFALKWLKADAAHARIGQSLYRDAYLLSIAPDPTVVTIGKVTITESTASICDERVALKVDQIAAFNAYVQTNFPELANAGGRVMGAVASNP